MIDNFRGDYYFLSNFYPHEMIVGEKPYATLEHAYQALKTNDPVVQEKIRLAESAGKAKKFGNDRSLCVLRTNWDSLKIPIMRALIDIKFQDEELRQKLLNTGDAELIEGNWWGDTFWGVCRGNGSNHLGKILMAKRNEFRLFS